jgi:hypothetical protein
MRELPAQEDLLKPRDGDPIMILPPFSWYCPW